MKRRGFLGFLGGAAVAAPSMVKGASASLADLDLPGIRQTPLGAFEYDSASNSVSSSDSIGGADPAYAVSRLDKLRRFLGDPNWVSRKKADWRCMGLDPDLASYKSLSLSSKIRMQRDREFERWAEREKSWFERRILGTEDY